jgi:hypothetical protein
MGLTVKRLPGEQIRIEVRPGTEPADLIEELQQGITITLIEHSRGGARLRIDAPKSLSINRPPTRLDEPEAEPGLDYSLWHGQPRER